MGPDNGALEDWVGRVSEVEDIVTPRLVASYRATLAGHLAEVEGNAAPLAVHWCLAPDIAEAAKLGPDGHPARGRLLPPVPLPHRMWAGSDIRLVNSFTIGDTVRRRSTITKVEETHGRSGPLVFVTVRHEFGNCGECAIEEDQIIVYREAAGRDALASPAHPLPKAAPYERKVEVDSVLLFRYSALTFNGHRIHYDLPYATGAEHYPGLVIHGPLQATLLLNFAAVVHGRPPKNFSFRGTHPATGIQTLTLCATPAEEGAFALEVRSADGHVTTKATAQW